jgi:glutathione S-transferase
MIKIYGMSGSPFVRRTELVLVEKSIDYELIALSRDDGDLQTTEYLAKNPRGRVPVMEDGDLTLYESQAIVEYLEERYPEPTLIPKDFGDRGHMRVAEMECLIYFSNALTALARAVFMVAPENRDKDKVSSALHDVSLELDRLEQRGSSRGDVYLMGDNMTRVDLTWLPFVELVGRAGAGIDDKKYGWTKKWRSTLSTRPSYDKTYPAHWR